jgi:pyridoxal phosphate enzyme (YggS family)
MIQYVTMEHRIIMALPWMDEHGKLICKQELPNLCAECATKKSRVMVEIENILKKINEVKSYCAAYPKAKLIVVTKNQPKKMIKALLEVDITEFGENKIQEIVQKFDIINKPNIHFIGKIQSNKCEQIVQYCSQIHALDRDVLVTKFETAEKKLGLKRQYFIQVNLAKEEQKGGILEEDLSRFVAFCKDRLEIIGLMILPPQNQSPQPFFHKLRLLANKHNLPQLSMGMSRDYEIALREGATCIRIGSLFFK